MAENQIIPKIGHLSKEQASKLSSIPIGAGQIIYNEKDGTQFVDYNNKRHSYGSVVSGIFNGSSYVNFSTSNLTTVINTIKASDSVIDGQLINVNNSIYMYKKINNKNFIVKVNDTQNLVNANTLGYAIYLPEYKSGDKVNIDLLVSISNDVYGEKVFLVKVENNSINFDTCLDLEGDFNPGSLAITLVNDNGLFGFTSTLNSRIRIISYSVTSSGSAINEGFYIASGDLALVYKWISASTLPYSVYNSSAVILNNEIHLLGGTGKTTSHYKWNGTTWSSVSTLPYALDGTNCAIVYNKEIHILGGSNGTAHYKWNGSSWVSVSTLPFTFKSGAAVVYDNELHILGGTSATTSHYRWNGTRWISASTLPYASSANSAVVHNNEIHLLGSGTAHYKWNGKTWSSVSALPYSLAGGVAVMHNGTIHILGGTANPSAHYTWNGTSWTAAEALPYAFVNGESVVNNGVLHILGSYANNSTTHATKHYKLEISNS